MRPLLRFPRLVWTSLEVVWSADRVRFALSAALQIGMGIAAGLQLFALTGAGTVLLRAAGRGASLAGTARGLAGAAVLTAVLGAGRLMRSAVQETILNIKVARIVDARILDVATVVDLESFDDPDFFDRLQRMSNDAMSRPGMMVRGLLGLLGSLLGIVGVGWALLALQPWLVPFVAVACVPLWILGVRSARETYRFSLRLAEGTRHRQYLRRVLTGRDEAKEVRLFGLAPLLRRHYDVRYDEWIAERRRLIHRGMMRQMAGQGSSAVVTGATVALLVWMVSTRNISLPAATAAAYGIQRLRGQVSSLLSSVLSLYECALFLEDLDAFLALKPAIEAARPKLGVDGPFAHLAVRDVEFAYPGAAAPTLRGVSMDVRAGEVVALVGANGSGKTTLAKLLCHLYRPSGGRILWDGVDTAERNPASAREHVAVIFQDFVRYELPARDNVAVGLPSRADDLGAIVEAARAVGAHDDLASLEHGYETYLSKTLAGGSDLSIGQWQRVALARAFFRDASFLVLDEPTASLDPRAEHELFEAVRDLCRDRAVLLISHRFSTVRAADRIYVMSAGEIVEDGSHDELMALGGVYAELFTLQASRYGVNVGAAG